MARNHTTGNVPAAPAARGLASLATDSKEGCLGDHVRKGLPQYHLGDAQRTSVRAALENRAALTTALGPKAGITRTTSARPRKIVWQRCT